MDRFHKTPLKGRGALSNATSRFAQQHSEAVDDGWAGQEREPAPRVELIRDDARTIISRNQSPDVPFDQSINPYRGCEHGCIYCYARPSHAYWGHSPGLDFETRLYYKPHAAELLRKELARPRYQCSTIALGVNTDGWQPIERKLKLSRALLEVLWEHRHPVCIVTKSALIERDLDLLAPMAEQGLVRVMISLATLDRELARRMDPRAAAPQRRLETVRRLREAGVPVGVLVAPVIPFLNDAELESLLEQAQAAGAETARYVLLRLPLELETIFSEWLAAHYPQRAERVMGRMRDCRGGKAYNSDFANRVPGQGVFAELIQRRFRMAARRLALGEMATLDCSRFRVPRDGPRQLDLFEMGG
jgi:DNA repair photolyase